MPRVNGSALTRAPILPAYHIAMDLIVLLLMMAVVAHDPSSLAPDPFLPTPAFVAAIFLPYLLLAAIEWIACRRALSHITRDLADDRKYLKRLDHILAGARYAALAFFLIDLYALGWLTWLRQQIGDLVLLDELLAIALPLASIAFGWSCYYPIDHRLRERSPTVGPASALGRGGTRGRYLLSQFRHQMLLILLPMCAVLAWTESVERWIGVEQARQVYESALALTGFLVIFAFAPVMIRYAWDTAPLPDDELGARLMAMCRDHRVGVRRLLVWRTYGGMINGAVMGIFAPLRFIFLTDGLLSRMTHPEIEAVMAHELGHVRRRHMVWLVVCAMASIFALETLARLAAEQIERLTGLHPETWTRYWQAVLAFGLMALIVPLWLALFGWISRRFERQADTFAVQHLSRQYPDELPSIAGSLRVPGASPPHDPSISPQPLISVTAVLIYTTALSRVAALNHMPRTRKSWRHGSIDWRCRYLESLIATPLDQCPIDRTVRRICVASAVILAVVLIFDVYGQ